LPASCHATHPSSELASAEVKSYVRYGRLAARRDRGGRGRARPRLAGRQANVGFDDVRAVAPARWRTASCSTTAARAGRRRQGRRIVAGLLSGVAELEEPLPGEVVEQR
jgi:hypothetical protein